MHKGGGPGDLKFTDLRYHSMHRTLIKILKYDEERTMVDLVQAVVDEWSNNLLSARSRWAT